MVLSDSSTVRLASSMAWPSVEHASSGYSSFTIGTVLRGTSLRASVVRTKYCTWNLCLQHSGSVPRAVQQGGPGTYRKYIRQYLCDRHKEPPADERKTDKSATIEVPGSPSGSTPGEAGTDVTASPSITKLSGLREGPLQFHRPLEAHRNSNRRHHQTKLEGSE
jgi:hypothetical protein